MQGKEFCTITRLVHKHIKYGNSPYRLARRRQNRHDDVWQTDKRQRENLEITESSNSIHLDNISVDDPDIIRQVQQFHSTLPILESVPCTTCFEQLPSVEIKI